MSNSSPRLHRRENSNVIKVLCTSSPSIWRGNLWSKLTFKIKIDEYFLQEKTTSKTKKRQRELPSFMLSAKIEDSETKEIYDNRSCDKINIHFRYYKCYKYDSSRALVNHDPYNYIDITIHKHLFLHASSFTLIVDALPRTMDDELEIVFGRSPIISVTDYSLSIQESFLSNPHVVKMGDEDENNEIAWYSKCGGEHTGLNVIIHLKDDQGHIVNHFYQPLPLRTELVYTDGSPTPPMPLSPLKDRRFSESPARYPLYRPLQDDPILTPHLGSHPFSFRIEEVSFHHPNQAGFKLKVSPKNASQHKIHPGILDQSIIVLSKPKHDSSLSKKKTPIALVGPATPPTETSKLSTTASTPASTPASSYVSHASMRTKRTPQNNNNNNRRHVQDVLQTPLPHLKTEGEAYESQAQFQTHQRHYHHHNQQQQQQQQQQQVKTDEHSLFGTSIQTIKLEDQELSTQFIPTNSNNSNMPIAKMDNSNYGDIDVIDLTSDFEPIPLYPTTTTVTVPASSSHSSTLSFTKETDSSIKTHEMMMMMMTKPSTLHHVSTTTMIQPAPSAEEEEDTSLFAELDDISVFEPDFNSDHHQTPLCKDFNESAKFDLDDHNKNPSLGQFDNAFEEKAPPPTTITITTQQNIPMIQEIIKEPLQEQQQQQQQHARRVSTDEDNIAPTSIQTDDLDDSDNNNLLEPQVSPLFSSSKRRITLPPMNQKRTRKTLTIETNNLTPKMPLLPLPPFVKRNGSSARTAAETVMIHHSAGISSGGMFPLPSPILSSSDCTLLDL